MLYDDDKIEEDEYTIYNNWFYEFLDEVHVTGLVYVRASPEICDYRVKKRGREGENIPLVYLQNCHKYHEEWINSETCSKLVINANIDSDENQNIRNKWLGEIDNFITSECNKCNKCDNSYIMHFDGGCRGNPSKIWGSGAVIYENGDEIWKEYKFSDNIEGTSNVAEYEGLILGLEGALENNIKNIVVKGDSALVINQITGKFNVNAARLQNLYTKAKLLSEQFEYIEFEYVKRDKNKRADQLANMAMDSITQQ